MKKSLSTLAAIFCICFVCSAQEKPENKQPDKTQEKTQEKSQVKLTEAEKLEIRTLQTDQLAAQVEEKTVEAQIAKAQTKVQQTTTALTDKIQEVFKKHNITGEEYVICGGPQPGPCASVPERDITIIKLQKSK